MRSAMFLTTLMLLASDCLADWSPRFSSGFFEATISYNGNGVSVSEPMTSNGYSNGALSALARPIYALPYQAKTALDDAARSLIARSSGVSVSYLSSEISGPIRLVLTGLTGQHAGLNQAAVSGLNYRAIVRATKSWHGFSGECFVTLTVTNVAAMVTYHPYSGVINPDPSLTYLRLNPSASASCSNNLDFIPIVGELFNGLLERTSTGTVVSLVNDFAVNAIRSVIPIGPGNFGIYSAIAPGQYVLFAGTPNAFDIGAYVRDNFADLFTGRMLTMTLGPENSVRSVAGMGEPYPDPHVGNTVTIDFWDANVQFTFSVRDVRYFDWEFYCKPGRLARSCLQP